MSVNTPDGMFIHQVRDLTEKYKRGGRVVVGHMAKLSLLRLASSPRLHAEWPDAALRSRCCRDLPFF